MDKKKVSFILTTFNCVDHLQETMESILAQDYPAIEIVVKDGQSTDGTKELIESYARELGNKLIWKSFADRGIYDAMNQGYQMSQGDIIVFFNDVLVHKSVVSHMVQAIESAGDNCIGAHADLIYADGDKVVRYWQMGEGKIKQGWMPGHPTLYLKREVYEQYGLYDTSYQCSADYEFMVRALAGREWQLAYVPETIVRMFYGGTSTQGLNSYFISLKEAHKGLKNNGTKGALLTDLRRTWRVLMQFKQANRYNTESDY